MNEASQVKQLKNGDMFVTYIDTGPPFNKLRWWS